MVMSHARKLLPVDLMRLYGKLHFFWDLESDTMTWQGPINSLFGSEIPFQTGARYLSRLSPENFWQRFNQICNQKKPFYQVSYDVILPNLDTCTLTEVGEIIHNSAGQAVTLKGYIYVTEDNQKTKPSNLSGYDLLTGFPKKEVMVEHISTLQHQHPNSVTAGGYVMLTLGGLSWLFLNKRPDICAKAIKEIGTLLKKSLRFNDTIGYTSGPCFEILLRDTDEWGMQQTAERLLKVCQIHLASVLKGDHHLTAAMGCCFIREDQEPLEVMGAVETNLLERDHTSEHALGLLRPDMDRPAGRSKGTRRFRDKEKSGARSQTRTGTPRRATDFKSVVSTDSTTRARKAKKPSSK